MLFSTTAQPGWRDARWLGAYHTASSVALGAAFWLLGSGVLGCVVGGLLGGVFSRSLKRIKLTKQIAPRFSFTYDPLGNQTTKIFGSAGRYHVPLPTNVAVRGAGSSYNARTAYAYAGVDATTGAPTGLTGTTATSG